MNFSGKNVLITGGAGHIGSNLAKELVKLGAKVKVADSLWRGNIDYLRDEKGDWIIDQEKDFMKIDLRLLENCEKCVKNVDIVFHLADVVAGILFVFDNMGFVFRSNILINSNMLAAAYKEKVDAFVYVGAACSYPMEKQNDPNAPPFKEEDMYPAHPESAYGWSKLMGEYEAGLYSDDKLLNTAILRFNNVFGPNSDLSPEKSQVIPALMRKAIMYPSEKFIVWGDGQQMRNFVYVSDAVDALLSAADKGLNKGPIQIGTKVKTKILEIAEAVIKKSGKDITIEYDTSMPVGDLGRSSDFSKAREILGWSPKVTLEEGISKTYDWAENFLKMKKIVPPSS